MLGYEFVSANLWLDCENLQLWRAHDVLHPSTSIGIRFLICMCCNLVIRPEPRVLLAHSAAHNCQCLRLLCSNLDYEHRSSVLWSFHAHFWGIKRPEPAALVGNDRRPCPSEQESRIDRDRELHQPGQPLVQSVLLAAFI